MRNIACICAWLLAIGLVSCKKPVDNGAKEMLQKAQTEYDEGRYSEALNTIEQLRSEYPEAIEERRQALRLFQEVSLKQAQEDLARTDSLLEDVKRRQDRLQAAMKQNPYSKQIERDLTEARRLKDSLQVRFDTQCEKIKYIHKKMKE